MKRPLRIDFTVIFDGADNLWNNDADFERDMFIFFRDLGVNPVVAKSVKGQGALYTIILEKKEAVEKVPTKTFVPPGKQLEGITKQIKSGKYV